MTLKLRRFAEQEQCYAISF